MTTGLPHQHLVRQPIIIVNGKSEGRRLRGEGGQAAGGIRTDACWTFAASRRVSGDCTSKSGKITLCTSLHPQADLRDRHRVYPSEETP